MITNRAASIRARLKQHACAASPETRLAGNYGGVRVELDGSLGGAHLKLQVDHRFR